MQRWLELRSGYVYCFLASGKVLPKKPKIRAIFRLSQSATEQDATEQERTVQLGQLHPWPYSFTLFTLRRGRLVNAPATAGMGLSERVQTPNLDVHATTLILYWSHFLWLSVDMDLGRGLTVVSSLLTKTEHDLLLVFPTHLC